MATKLKDVEKLNYVELKQEAKIRGVYKVPITTSIMVAEVKKHREENPNFDLSPQVEQGGIIIMPHKDHKKLEVDEIKIPLKELIEESKKPAKKKTLKKVSVKKAIASARANETKKETKPVKKAAVKKAKKIDSSIDVEALIKKYKPILSKDYKTKYKIVALHISGASKKEIEAMLGTNQGWIWNELNSYKLDKKAFTYIIGKYI